MKTLKALLSRVWSPVVSLWQLWKEDIEYTTEMERHWLDQDMDGEGARAVFPSKSEWRRMRAAKAVAPAQPPAPTADAPAAPAKAEVVPAGGK